MGSLGLHADPDGWLNAGYSIRTLMDSLDSEFYDADRIGGAGLSQSWAGPVAEAFTGHWSGLRSRAEDLIAQGRQAAAAITDFGGRLEDFVKRAADLESHWLSFGLQIGLDGMHFALPWGFEQLPAAHQVSFHQWLTESERDVTAMWADIRAAVDDVATALESLIAAFDDYVVLELGTAAGALRWVWNAEVSDPLGRLDDGVSLLAGHLDRASTRALDHAYKVVVGAGDDASHDLQAAADATTRSAIRDAKVARAFDEVDKWAGRTVAVIAVGVTLWQTYDTAENEKQGWVNAIEDHAGDWANLGAGAAAAWGAGLALAAVGAPVAVAVVGVAVVGYIGGVGVGDLVQSYVNHHHAQVGHAITDVGHGVEDAAGWEAKRIEGLVKFT
jgi:hypothetical protein